MTTPRVVSKWITGPIDVPEKTTRIISGLLKDENGQPIPGSSLEQATLQLYVVPATAAADVTYINGTATPRDISAAFNESGQMEVVLDKDDNPHLGADELELHAAVIRGEYNGGRAFMHKVLIQIIDERSVV